MRFKTFLEKAGEDVLKVLTFGEIVAKDAAPFISIADPALGALIDSTVSAIIAAQAAGTSAVASAPAASNGAQKSALAITAIEPLAVAYAKKLGASDPTEAQMQQWINGFVLALNAFQLPVAEAAPPANG